MDPGTPSHRIPQWRSRLRHDFVISIDQVHIHIIDDALQAISKTRQLENKTVVSALTKDYAQNCISTVSFPQLYVDHLRVMNWHILHAALAVFHKAVTGLKFNRGNLQQQLNWNEWQDAKCI
jgi:hypothetical protein